MQPLAEIDALPEPELRTLLCALRAAIAAAEMAEAMGGGGFEAAILADGEGVSVTFTLAFNTSERS